MNETNAGLWYSSGNCMSTGERGYQEMSNLDLKRWLSIQPLVLLYQRLKIGSLYPCHTQSSVAPDPGDTKPLAAALRCTQPHIHAHTYA